VEACVFGKHFKKLPSIFGGHLMYANIFLRKKKKELLRDSKNSYNLPP
jgi:hypothetical protein